MSTAKLGTTEITGEYLVGESIEIDGQLVSRGRARGRREEANFRSGHIFTAEDHGGSGSHHAEKGSVDRVLGVRHRVCRWVFV